MGDPEKGKFEGDLDIEPTPIYDKVKEERDKSKDKEKDER